MPVKKNLIMIDDAADTHQFKDYFAKFGYQLLQYPSLAYLKDQMPLPEALLINWKILPDDAVTVIHQLYLRFPVPLLVLSDDVNEVQCITMLEAGADDFLVKPIHPRELHARITAIKRRVSQKNQTLLHDKEIWQFAEWRLLPGSRQVFSAANEEIQLSSGEYDLLVAFLNQPQCILDRAFLTQITSHGNQPALDRHIDVQISRLRQKMEPDAKRSTLIKTIRNSGYLFTASVIRIKNEGLLP